MTEKVEKFRHDQIKTFGVGADMSKQEWGSIYRQLVAAGYLKVDHEGYGARHLTASSRPVLKGQQSVACAATIRRRSRNRSAPSAAAAGRSAPAVLSRPTTISGTS